MKKISDNPECFSITAKEIAKNNFILSPHYYLEKKKHSKLNKWFLELSLKEKERFKRLFEFVKELYKR
ncbi:hypothetical protein ES705_14733 [subsurface metagenome]